MNPARRITLEFDDDGNPIRHDEEPDIILGSEDVPPTRRLSSFLAIVGAVLTILTGVVGSTWYLATRIGELETKVAVVGQRLDDHIVSTGGRP